MVKSLGRIPFLFVLMALLGAALLMGAAACGGDGAEGDGAAAAAAEKAAAAAEKAATAAQGAGTAASEAGAVAEGAAMSAEGAAMAVGEAVTAAQGAATAAEGAAMAAQEAGSAAEGAAMAAGEAVTAAQGAATAAEGAAMAAEEVSAMAMAPKETIVFADLNWDSAQMQNAIARRIVEEGYGYPTDAIFGGTVTLQPGLLKGDIDVDMEIWLPNQQEFWDTALAEGAIIPVGKSLDDNWQSAYVVPTYVVEQNLGLKTVQDIRDHLDKFPQEGGKAILWNCISTWACAEKNEGALAAYGLDDIITLQDPGSDASLFASLEGAYAKEEAWLGYMWGPTKVASELDLTRLEEPECAPGKGPETGCAYGVANIRIAVHPTLVSRAPDVIEFLRKWDFSAAIDIAANTYKADNDATFPEVATWFLRTHEDVWTKWVPADVAERVKDSLG